VAVSGETICYVGPISDFPFTKGPKTITYDCNGGTVVAGFNDAHCHPLALAVNRLHADCTEASCLDEVRAVITCYMESGRSTDWVHAVNCNFDALSDDRLPNRHDVDLISSTVPILLLDRTGQRCVLNSPALTRCGIGRHASGCDGSVVFTDPDSGQPTGLIEGNDARITQAMPGISDVDLSWAARQVSDHFLSLGITSVQDTSWTNSLSTWQRIAALKDRQDFRPRLSVLPGMDFVDEFAAAHLSSGSGDNQLRVGAAKIALDESSDDAKPPQELINSAAFKAHEAGFQLAFHVPDIYLLTASIRALEYVRQHSSQPVIRPRFEHCPICPPQLIASVARCGASVVAQPNLFYQLGDDYLRQLPEEQLSWVYPLKSFADQGIRVSFSSDAPLTPCDPLQALYTVVTRNVVGGDVLSAQERLSPRQALAMYSEFGAYVSMEENLKGKVVSGMLADLVVLTPGSSFSDQELFSELTVAATFLGGQLVWEKPQLKLN